MLSMKSGAIYFAFAVGATLVQPIAHAKDDFIMDNSKVVPLTRFLEEKPFDEMAPKVRALLLEWEAKSKDTEDVVCPGVLAPVPSDKISYSSELVAQFIFGSAAYQIANPSEKGKLFPQQLAGMQSMLKAYRSIVAAKPKAKTAAIDELVQKDANGQLAQYLEPLVARECKNSKK